LAIAMAAAARLTPEGEQSVYAMARDNSAMKAFYATNWFHAAHTGGGMGEIWHHGAMALVREKRPVPYRSYHDTRRWVMDLSRRFDGSVAIEGMDDRYNRSLTDASAKRDWGTFFALTYTYPRKALQLWGAPRSPYAKTYQLPERPWGTAADDFFNSPEPIYIGEQLKLTKEELLSEQVPEDASLPASLSMKDPNITEQEMFKYILHPEYGLRKVAMREVVNQGWTHLVTPLLKSGDPRLREAGLLTIAGMFKGRPFSDDLLTEEMFEAVSQIVDDPNESWWVRMQAIKALGRADQSRIAEHRDVLMQLMNHESTWVATEAVVTLLEIAGEKDHYKTLLPAIIDTASSFTIDEASIKSFRKLDRLIARASPDVKAFADPYLKSALAEVPPQLVEPHTGAVMRNGAKTVRVRLASVIEEIPGGEAFIRRIPKTTLESYKSGRDADMYQYSGTFEPNDQLLGEWKWIVWPPANYPDEIDDKVRGWMKKGIKNGVPDLSRSKDTLIIQPDGKTKKSGYYRSHFWSGNMLVGLKDDQALKMEVRTYNGFDFLIIERAGKFGGGIADEGVDAIPDDWHPGYHIYIRNE